MKRITGIFVMILGVVLYSTAQTRTVTNFDLEKYRTQRIAAERDLRQNHEKLGFPSPEELEKQRTDDSNYRIELGARLRADRLERESIEAALQQRAYEAELAAQPNIIVINGQGSNNPVYPYYGGYGTYGGYGAYGGGYINRYPGKFPGRYPIQNGNIGWRASGGMVIYGNGGNSSTGVGTPIFTPPFRYPR